MFKALIRTLALLFALEPALALAQSAPATLGYHTVYGRIGATPGDTGPGQAIPFTTLTAQLLSGGGFAKLAGGNTFTGPQVFDLAGTSGAFDILADTSGSITPFFQSTNYSGVVGGIGGAFHGQIARGTLASPLAPIAGDSPTAIGGHVWIPGVGWSTSSPAAIFFNLTETQSTTNNGAQVNIYATPIGSTFANRVNAFTVDANSAESFVSVNAGGHTGTLNARLNINGANAAGQGAKLNLQKAGTAGWFLAHVSAILGGASTSNDLTFYNTNTGVFTAKFSFTDDSAAFGSTVNGTSGTVGAINTLGGIGATKDVWAGANVIATGAHIAKGSAPVGTTGSCVASSFVGGTTAGKFSAAVCAAGTIILSGLPTAPNGYTCSAQDQTTPADTLQQTANTVTSVTFKATTVAADVVAFMCMAW